MKTGVKRDGELTGLAVKVFLDGGAFSSFGIASTYYTGALTPITYKLPTYKFDGVRVFTNKPPCGPKRGHGGPQPRFGFEIQLDKIACELGMDPIDLRLRNLIEPYSTTVNSLRVTSCGLRECIEKVSEASGWKERRGELAALRQGARLCGERVSLGHGNDNVASRFAAFRPRINWTEAALSPYFAAAPKSDRGPTICSPRLSPKSWAYPRRRARHCRRYGHYANRPRQLIRAA